MWKSGICLWLILSCWQSVVARADNHMVTIEGRPERQNGIYKVGERMRFVFHVRRQEGKEGRAVPGAICQVEFLGDQSLSSQRQSVPTDFNGKILVSTVLHRPGAVRCKVSIGKDYGVAGAVASPELIRSGRPEPADFEDYWKNLKQVIDRAPLQAQLRPVKQGQKDSTIEVFDLVLACPESRMPVTGYLVKPKLAKAHSLPAILHVQWATVRSAVPPRQDGKSMLALEINANGVPNGKPADYYRNLREHDLKRYWHFGMTRRDDIYFRDMFLRVYRALQYLKACPEWDRKTLIVEGTSQGGGQALAGAGLDPEVTAVIALVPGLCDHGGHAAGRQSGWPQYNRETLYKQQPQVCAQAADYVDAVFFASRIKHAQVFMATGLNDYMCAAPSVCAAFNAIASLDKQLMIVPQMGHFKLSPEVIKGAARFKEQHLKRLKRK